MHDRLSNSAVAWLTAVGWHGWWQWVGSGLAWLAAVGWHGWRQWGGSDEMVGGSEVIWLAAVVWQWEYSSLGLISNQSLEEKKYQRKNPKYSTLFLTPN